MHFQDHRNTPLGRLVFPSDSVPWSRAPEPRSEGWFGPSITGVPGPARRGRRNPRRTLTRVSGGVPVWGIQRSELAPTRSGLEEGFVAEAPRGTLIHHYRIDDHGLMIWVNLMIATGHNALVMNRGVLQAAREFVSGERLQEGALNRVEAVIRTFDPCLSCSTHALGEMPLKIQLRAADGALLHELSRDP